MIRLHEIEVTYFDQYRVKTSKENAKMVRLSVFFGSLEDHPFPGENSHHVQFPVNATWPEVCAHLEQLTALIRNYNG